jgi:hypothetical protein
MPQFDQFSFFTQVSWFLCLFFLFYFLITYFYLPKICYNIKFRKKKILFNKEKTNQIIFEKLNIIYFFNNINKKFFNTFDLFLNQKSLIYLFNKKIYNNFLLEDFLKKNIELILNRNFLFIKKFFI